jgi:hypothetical protein
MSRQSNQACPSFLAPVCCWRAAYVIMIAGANEIAASAVGLVYFCAIFPTLLVKLSAPYWCVPCSMHTCTYVVSLHSGTRAQPLVLSQLPVSLSCQHSQVQHLLPHNQLLARPHPWSVCVCKPCSSTVPMVVWLQLQVPPCQLLCPVLGSSLAHDCILLHRGTQQQHGRTGVCLCGSCGLGHSVLVVSNTCCSLCARAHGACMPLTCTGLSCALARLQ